MANLNRTEDLIEAMAITDQLTRVKNRQIYLGRDCFVIPRSAASWRAMSIKALTQTILLLTPKHAYVEDPSTRLETNKLDPALEKRLSTN